MLSLAGHESSHQSFCTENVPLRQEMARRWRESTLACLYLGQFTDDLIGRVFASAHISLFSDSKTLTLDLVDYRGAGQPCSLEPGGWHSNSQKPLGTESTRPGSRHDPASL